MPSAAKSEEQFVQDAGVVGVETLAAGATAHYIANFNDGIRDLSPTVRVFLSQNVLEPLLREAAERLGARIDFSTECVSFEQDADGVTAVIRHRDTGETRQVRAQYMIAADGAHSRIREALGMRMRGHGTFSSSVTIYFRANLRGLLEGNPGRSSTSITRSCAASSASRSRSTAASWPSTRWAIRRSRTSMSPPA